MRTGNPALKAETFEWFGEINGPTMTLEGTTNKSYLLLGLMLLTAVPSWLYMELVFPFFIPVIIVNLILGFVIIWKNKLAPTLAPIYALIEWVFIAVISYYFEMQYPGIIIQAVSITFWVFLMMLVLYQTKIIKPTENFKMWIVAATLGIMVVYLGSFLVNLMGFNIGSIHQVWGFLGIAISVVIAWIAAMNLVLDFDFIETWVELKAPKHMEWYAAFGLLVTLVWLYIEILRLISKMRD